jgi:hypothetical protein
LVTDGCVRFSGSLIQRIVRTPFVAPLAVKSASNLFKAQAALFLLLKRNQSTEHRLVSKRSFVTVLNPAKEAVMGASSS